MLTSVQYNYPTEYKLFLAHFHGSRDFFECHEILEEYWLEQNRDVRWLALIQLAVAVYHERQGNVRGSHKLYRKVLAHLSRYPSMFEELSINEPELVSIVQQRLISLEEGGEYVPFNLPVFDQTLLQECRIITDEWRVAWQGDDRNAPAELKFKHRLRDRSEVIEARKESLKSKVLER